MRADLDTRVKHLLAGRKDSVLRRWFDSILESYPEDTARFLKDQKDRFANPVGGTALAAMGEILELLLRGGPFRPEDAGRYLDDLIRIRAVQGFSASQSVSFVFDLKRIIREELETAGKGDIDAAELRELEPDVDSLALLSFDIYMKCREKLYELKSDELRRRTFRLLKKAGIDSGEEDEK
jgi:hypothetical protein